MDVTSTSIPPWLLLLFSLPSKSASARVGIWRKLQKFGAIRFRSSGYLLPHDPTNQERLEWLARSVREAKGDASVVQVAQIDDLSIDGIQHLFREARDPDYTALLSELAKLKRSQPDFDAQLNRMRERFKEIVAIDFFESSSRKKVEDAMLKLTPQVGKQGRAHTLSISAYKGRAWVTRPRPGIDRVSSAWLIRRFIDADAKFSFATSAPGGAPDVVPFDMYESGGFGHEGDACTFETICKSFNLSEQKVGVIAEMIHDADLEDARFGRSEGFAINSVLKGWAVQNLADDEILRRGIDLIEGLYLSMAGEAQ